MNTLSRGRFKNIVGWILFDWANSAFPTIITTFVFAAYFTEKVAPSTTIGTAQWGDAMAISGLIIALCSPILGAIADYEGRRKPWLAFFTFLCIIPTALLWYVKPDVSYTTFALICVILGTIGLEVGMVFYNAMLSDIAPANYIGRLSGWGWGLGYFGGLTCLVIVLFVFIQGDITWIHLDKSTAEQVRISGPLVAVWFAIFAWPLFVFVDDKPSSGLGIKKSIRRGTETFIETLRSLKAHREIFKFIVARILYIDGLNTIFAFGGIYAAGTFGMNFDEVIKFGITLNVGAGIGAGIFAWLDDAKGPKPTILISLAIMIVSGAGMLLTHSVEMFWILGVILSLCVGPVQSASRSLLIHIAPKEMITEMFGLYALSGKITAFLGPWLLAILTKASNSQRVGMSTVVLFLFVGGLILVFVKPTRD